MLAASLARTAGTAFAVIAEITVSAARVAKSDQSAFALQRIANAANVARTETAKSAIRKRSAEKDALAKISRMTRAVTAASRENACAVIPAKTGPYASVTLATAVVAAREKLKRKPKASQRRKLGDAAQGTNPISKEMTPSNLRESSRCSVDLGNVSWVYKVS